MNNIILMGRLARDAKFVVLDNKGVPGCVADFTLAVRRNATVVDYIDCKAYNRGAELVRDYCTKGSTISVIGSLWIETYKGQDGTKKYHPCVHIHTLEFVDTRGTEERKQNAKMRDLEYKTAKLKAKRRPAGVAYEDTEPYYPPEQPTVQPSQAKPAETKPVETKPAETNKEDIPLFNSDIPF